MSREEIIKVAKGAAVAAAGAVLTYVSQWITGQDFGIYQPAVVAVLSVVANVLRKYAGM